MASEAVGGNMHMDTRVIRVADFKSEVKWPLRSLSGCHGLGGCWRQYAHGYQGNQGCWFQIWSQITSKVIESRVNGDHTAPHAYFSLPLSPQVYRAIALLFWWQREVWINVMCHPVQSSVLEPLDTQTQLRMISELACLWNDVLRSDEVNVVTLGLVLGGNSTGKCLNIFRPSWTGNTGCGWHI